MLVLLLFVHYFSYAAIYFLFNEILRFLFIIIAKNEYNLHLYISINHQLINFNSVVQLRIIYFNFIIMASKYHSIVSLYLKHTPLHSQKVVEGNFQKAELESRKQNDRMFYMMERYITSLETHREYLEFFQIGVVRDNKKKIQNVAKYVGLAIPGIDSHLRGDLSKKAANNDQNTINNQQNQQNSKQSN